MIQVSIKHLSPTLKSNMLKLAGLGKAKLFELMTKDNNDLAELAEGGTIVGLTLDEVDRISVSEPHAKLREVEESLKASRHLANEKDQKVNELSEKRLLD